MSKSGNSPFGSVATELIVLLCIAITYTFLIVIASPEELWSWLSTFLATLVSVIAAFYVALALYKYQARDADSLQRQSLKALIELEIADTIESFGRPKTAESEPDTDSEGPVSVTHVQPLLLEEAIKSGLFRQSFTHLMLQVVREMYIYNMEVRQLHAYFEGGESWRIQLQQGMVR